MCVCVCARSHKHGSALRDLFLRNKVRCQEVRRNPGLGFFDICVSTSSTMEVSFLEDVEFVVNTALRSYI